MKSMRDKNTLYADIENSGQIFVEKHYVGKLEGFRFTPDTAAAGLHGKAARHAAAKVLAVELTDRAGRLCDAKDQLFKLERNGAVSWEGQEIGRLEAGEDPLRPAFALIADEHLPASDKERIIKRVEAWLEALVESRLKPLVELSKAQDITGLARGIAFRLVENFGILRRETVSEEIRSLDQQARAELRRFGVRFGAYNIYFPLLLKPAAADLLLLLWALRHGSTFGIDTANLPEPPRQGLTSVPVDKSLPEPFYAASGFHVCGPRAIRIDMLERLADQIRPLTSWRPTAERPDPPAGSIGRGGFKIQPEMLSIIGCSLDEMGNVLFALGFRKERRPVEKLSGSPTDRVDPQAIAGASSMTQESQQEHSQPQDQKDSDIAAGSQGSDTGERPAESDLVGSLDNIAIESTSAETAPSASPADGAYHNDSAPLTQTSPAETPADPEFEDIWRPRRRGQGDERQSAERRPNRPQHARRNNPPSVHTPTQSVPANAQGSPAASEVGQHPERRRHDRHDRNRQDDNRRQERRGGKPRANPTVKSAAPPLRRAKDGAPDRDSPFAALLELKERMSREAQDQA